MASKKKSQVYGGNASPADKLRMQNGKTNTDPNKGPVAGLPSGGGTSAPPLGTPPPAPIPTQSGGQISLPMPLTTTPSIQLPSDPKELGNVALGNAGDEAMRLTTEEEKRGARAEDIISEAAKAASAPTLTDQDIQRQFGMDVDAQSQDFLGNMSSLRDYMGEAGVTGGGQAQAMATNFELGRLGQQTDARRSLFMEKAKSDSLDRVRNFQNQMALATQVQRPVAMEWSDYLGDLTGIGLAREGFASAEKQAKSAASATKSSGKSSGIGSIIGGVLGMF